MLDPFFLFREIGRPDRTGTNKVSFNVEGHMDTTEYGRGHQFADKRAVVSWHVQKDKDTVRTFVLIGLARPRILHEPEHDIFHT